MSQSGRISSGGGGSDVLTLTGNTGGPVGPTGGNINTVGGNNITATGNPGTSTITFSVTGTTNHAVQVGNASGSLTSIPVGTTGQVLTGVTGSDPVFADPAASSISITGDSGGALTGNAFTFTGGATGLTFAGAGTTETLGGTLAIAHGGTNATSFAITDGTVYFDGTRLVTTTTGTAGQILTSNGVGIAPTYQTSSGANISITGDTGGALTSGSFTFTGGTTGLSFGGAGTTETLTFAGITANGGTVSLATDATNSTINVGTGAGVKTTTLGSTNSTSTTTIACGTGGCNVGTSANVHATTVGSTTALATTTIQGPSAGVFALGVQGVVVSNKNYVTINTSTGALGSDAGPSSSITITGDSGGGLTGSSFTFTGGTTGLTFAGAGTTETLGGTLAIANGGTNATSMATSTGIVKYDGTRLVTSSTAKIDSSNRQTNTSQPAFYAYLNTATGNNVTGDGTNYTVAYNATLYDQNSNFNTGTSTFTAPVTGIYNFNIGVLGTNMIAASNPTLELVTTARTYIAGNTAGAFLGNNQFQASWTVQMTATDTATVIFTVSGGTKSVGVYGAAATDSGRTFLAGYLVC